MAKIITWEEGSCAAGLSQRTQGPFRWRVEADRCRVHCPLIVFSHGSSGSIHWGVWRCLVNHCLPGSAVAMAVAAVVMAVGAPGQNADLCKAGISEDHWAAAKIPGCRQSSCAPGLSLVSLAPIPWRVQWRLRAVGICPTHTSILQKQLWISPLGAPMCPGSMLLCRLGGSSGSAHCDCKGSLREFHLPLGAGLSKNTGPEPKCSGRDRLSHYGPGSGEDRPCLVGLIYLTSL